MRQGGSWLPNNHGQTGQLNHQQRGFALPPVPVPRTSEAPVNRRTCQPSRAGDSEVAQSRQQQPISTHLEQQIRGLADFSNTSNPPITTSASAPTLGQHARPVTRSDVQTSSQGQSMLPQRGAKAGDVLKFACEACQRRKRKCTRNFPCTECQTGGDECVPSTRKQPRGRESNNDQDAELQDEDAPQPAETNEDSANQKKRRHRDDSPNRKYMLNMPPIVGCYMEWSNKRLKYNPFPDNLDSIREKLFKLEKPILLNSQQWADYWPHVSNVYNRSQAPFYEANGTTTEIWECRNQRRPSRKKSTVEPHERKRKRESKTHLLEGNEMCKLRFRMVMYTKHGETEEDHKLGLGHCQCVPEWTFMMRMRHSVDIEHNHTLESLDKFKRSDALLFFARQKVEEGGYLYAAVRRWMKEKFANRTNQLEFLSDSDVANAARRWRVHNRDLELVETIDEPSPEGEQRKRCLGLVETTTAGGLKKALLEVCKRMPEAASVALPFLEAAQEQGQAVNEQTEKIMEGADIVVPNPGLPGRRNYQLTIESEKNAAEGSNASTTSGPASAAHSTHLAPTPSISNGTQPPSAVPQLAGAQDYPQLYRSPYVAVPQYHSPYPNQPPMAPPPLPGRYAQFQPAPSGQPSPMYLGARAGLLNAAYAASSGAQPSIAQAQSNATSGRPAEEQRPSWARPNQNACHLADVAEKDQVGPPVKIETDETRVQRQLDAELQTQAVA